MPRRLKHILIFIGAMFLLIFLTLSAAVGILYWKGFFTLPDFSKLEDRHATSILYDQNGEPIAEYCEFCRELIPLSAMGHFPQIAIAVEDQRFETRLLPYDLFSLARAAWCYFRTGKSCGGASTLSMQLARNTFLQPELKRQWTTKDPAEKKRIIWSRKLQEAWMAALLEYYLGRKNRWRVLEHYLNTANCGENFYGIKTCSKLFFSGKDPQEISIPDAAWIVSLWRSPRYGSLKEKDHDEALKLRNRVLHRLAAAGVITNTQEQKFIKTPLPKRSNRYASNPCMAEHAAEFARLTITAKMRWVDEGLKGYTTINCEIQRPTVDALHRSLEAMRERNPELRDDLWGIALALDARNGDIKAFAQEPSFTENEYRQIKRHVGSTAKMYGVLLHLLWGGRLSCNDKGTGRCTCNDSPMSLYLGKDAGRKHFGNFPYEGLPRYRGQIPFMQGLEESRNLCYLGLIKGIGGGLGIFHKDHFTETILRLGITLPPTKGTDILSEELSKRMNIKRQHLDPGHTGIIGSFDATVFELARSWTPLYGGIMVEPRIIDQIIDETGESTHFPPHFYGNIIAEMWIEAQKETLRWQDAYRLQKLYETHGIKKSQRTIYRKEVFPIMTFDEETLKQQAPQAAQIVTLALIRGLRGTVEGIHGTAKLARKGDEEHDIPKLEFDLACKTGTATNTQRETTDNWIVCRTTTHVVVVWIGRKNQLPMESFVILPDGTQKKYQETGGGNALPAAILILNALSKIYPQEPFPEATNPKNPFPYIIPTIIQPPDLYMNNEQADYKDDF